VSSVLVVNAGSSSLKLRVLGAADEVTASADLSPWDGSPDDPGLRRFLDGLPGIVAVGHRVVHGGHRFTAATPIDDEVVAGIAALTDLAPLHQPGALAGIAATRSALPGVPEVACFDTAFHAALPAAAAAYALPAAWTRRFGLRRFGFHGLSHSYAAGRAAQLTGNGWGGGAGTNRAWGGGAGTNRAWGGGAGTNRAWGGGAGAGRARDGGAGTNRARDGGAGAGRARDGGAGAGRARDGGAGAARARGGGAGAGKSALRHRVVTCHLGAGSSLAAVLDGRCVDTTMGFTPLEGLVMATRSGNVDPGLIVWLLRYGGLSVDEVSDGLEHSAGLAGLADLPGGSGDMRDVRLAAARGNPRARLALEVYGHRLRAQIAAMTAALGGLDTLVFTGGIGEHQADVRAEAVDGLGFLGVAMDGSRNATARPDCDISLPGAAVRTLVIAAREDIEIARQTRAALAAE
jgi:acetate kinase